MNSKTPSASSSLRYRAVSQQLLGGLIVVMMFLVIAAAGFNAAANGREAGQLTSKSKTAREQLQVRFRRNLTSGETVADRRISADGLSSRYADLATPDLNVSSESAVLRIKVSELSRGLSMDAPLVQILDMVIRNGRHSHRRYCFQTRNEASLRAVFPYAEFVANKAALMAHQLSFRIDANIPEDEVWLEIRSDADPESNEG